MSTMITTQAERSAENRRRGGRYPMDVPATLCGDDGSALSVRLIELSVAGVGLFSEQSPACGVIYELAAFDPLIPDGMRVRIVWSHPEETGGFAVGAEVVKY